MEGPETNGTVSLNSILEKPDIEDLDADASTAIDADDRAEHHADADDPQLEDASEDSLVQGRRGFSKLMLSGAMGAFGLSGAGAARGSRTNNWRKEYHKFARDYVPAFYKSVPSKKNLYRCVKYAAKTTNFWKTLGKKMNLEKTVVTSAYFHPIPNYKKVEKKAWDGILSDMYADMPKKYRKKPEYKRRWPITVPLVVVYLYDGYYNAVAYLRPYGKSYKSYGYAIKNGYRQKQRYDSKSDYESNIWWFTEDGWGDAGDTEGGILDGVPTGLVN
jgi:hypothetical protein